MFAPTRAGEKATILSRLTRYLCCLAQADTNDKSWQKITKLLIVKKGPNHC